jgi:hypothetical protein
LLDGASDENGWKRKVVGGCSNGGRKRVARRIDQAAEGEAVAALDAVCNGCRDRIVLMRHMRDGAHREAEEHGCEHNSQPLRPTTGELEEEHGSAQLWKPERLAQTLTPRYQADWQLRNIPDSIGPFSQVADLPERLPSIRCGHEP